VLFYVVAVTAEVAGSSPVVPAILSKRFSPDFDETIEDPKGHVFVPFFVSLFARPLLAPVDSLTLQLRLMTTVVALHALRMETPTPRRLPELHVWLALWLGCRYPMWIATLNAAAVLASP
jgi:hypothetical protein